MIYVDGAARGLAARTLWDRTGSRTGSRSAVPGPGRLSSLRAGTVISFSGFSYVIQGDETMLLAQQTGGTSIDSGPSAGQP